MPSQSHKIMAKYTNFDVCVIGAGIMGCSTAYFLARNGKRVVLLEQYPIPHSRGSSHGQSRMFRHAYTDWKYTQFMPESMELWKEIERDSGRELLTTIGMLAVGDKGEPFLEKNYQCLKDLDLLPKLLNQTALTSQYPMLRFDQDSVGAVYEPEACLLNANQCLRTLQDLILKYNGTIVDHQQVTSINSQSDPIEITTNGERVYAADKLVITTGAYSTAILQKIGLHVPIQPLAIKVCYWPTVDDRYSVAKGFPSFMHRLPDGSYVFIIPTYEYPGLVKVQLHSGPKTTPDRRSSVLRDDNTTVQTLQDYIKKHLDGIVPEPAIMEECLYAVTADSTFVIGRLPSNINVVVGTGFCGHGFKMAPLVGKILGQLAFNEKVKYDLSTFNLERFEAESLSGPQSKKARIEQS